jgi:hypothetical protein
MKSATLSSHCISGGFGRYRIAREPSFMRIPDEFLKSVGFIAEITHSDSTGIEYEVYGTGFFVSIPSPSVEGKSFPCFVTAKHVVQGLQDKEVHILVNQKGGGTITLPNINNCWWVHPSDKTADVAVMTCNFDQELLDSPYAVRFEDF